MLQPITLLGFDGCPNTPIMRDRLAEALRLSGIRAEFESIDLAALPECDPRRGHGAPTVLIGNEDLFGQAPAASSELTCRVYPGGPPDARRMAARLRELSER